MTYNKIFISVVDDILRKNGYIRKGNAYYCWLREEGIVKLFSYQMQSGSRAFQFLIALTAYVDGISFSNSHLDEIFVHTNDMICYNQRLFVENNRSVVNNNGPRKYSEEEFETAVSDEFNFLYDRYLKNMFSIDTLEKLFEFKVSAKLYAYRNPLSISSSDCMYEAIQLGNYDYAIKSIDIFINHNRSYITKSQDSLKNDIFLLIMTNMQKH